MYKISNSYKESNLLYLISFSQKPKQKQKTKGPFDKRFLEVFVMERLDRAFAYVEWINTYPYYVLCNHPILRSDHGSILLDFEMQQPFRRRPLDLKGCG